MRLFLLCSMLAGALAAPTLSAQSRDKARDICLTVEPPYMGGLSNSIAFINEATTFAVARAGLRVVTPNLKISGHHNSPHEEFADLLTGSLPPLHKSLLSLDTGGGNVPKVWGDVTCHVDDIPDEALERYTQEWQPKYKRKSQRCPFDQLTFKVPGSKAKGLLGDDVFLQVAESMKGIPFQSADPTSSLANYNGCSLVVVISGDLVHYHHDYHLSAPVLSAAYWQKYPRFQPPAAVSRLFGAGQLSSGSASRLTVSFHFRLGDVYHSVVDKSKDRWINKLMSPMWVPFGLYLLQQAVPNMACMDFHLFCDEEEGHPAVEQIKSSLRAHDLPLPSVHGSDVPARQALDGMAWSDVLVVGGSGFGRVGAVLNRGVSLAPNAFGHPLQDVPGVVEIQEIEDKVLWNDAGLKTVEQAEALARTTLDGPVCQARERLRRELRMYVTRKRPELVGPCGFSAGEDQPAADAVAGKESVPSEAATSNSPADDEETTADPPSAAAEEQSPEESAAAPGGGAKRSGSRRRFSSQTAGSSHPWVTYCLLVIAAGLAMLLLAAARC